MRVNCLSFGDEGLIKFEVWLVLLIFFLGCFVKVDNRWGVAKIDFTRKRCPERVSWSRIEDKS